MDEKKQVNNSVQEILKEILAKDINLLNSRDDLIKQLSDKVSGSATRELNPIRKALQNNVGEVLLSANIDGSEEAKEEAKNKIIKILQEQNLQERAINKTIDTFVYALDWNKPKEQPPEIKEEPILPQSDNTTPVENEAQNDIHIEEEKIPAKETWVCSCGTENDQNFCSSCGQPKPSATYMHNDEWVCPICGTANTEKFCSNCGHAHDSSQATNKTVSDETQYIPPVTAPEPEPQPKVEPQKSMYSNPNAQPTYTDSTFNNENTQTPPPNKKSTSKYIMGGVIGILLVLVVVFGVKAMRNNDTSPTPTINSSSSNTNNTFNSESKKAPTAQSDLSLGGVDLGNTVDQMHNILGQEDNTKQKGNYMFYNYASIQVGVKDGKVDALVSEDTSVETKRGIHQGSTVQDVFDKYGKNYTQSTYDGLTLYEYIFPSIDGRDGILRFAINSNNQVQYISVRIPDDGTSSNGVSQNAKDAAQVLGRYYAAISNHDMRAAYNLLSAEMQNGMGSIDVYASGYKTTISDDISDVTVTSDSGDQIAFAYTLTARDKVNNGIKVQTFACTALLSKKTGSWHIINMSAKKQSEHIE